MRWVGYWFTVAIGYGLFVWGLSALLTVVTGDVPAWGIPSMAAAVAGGYVVGRMDGEAA